MSSRFGSRFVIQTFGESHGPALGVVIEGCPAGLEFDEKHLQACLDRRKPGGALVSGRQEADKVEILSGVYQGKTLGSPISMMVRNVDARSEDYKNISERPGHADDLWQKKFLHSDPRGGGRASGRETVSRVMAGAVAQMLCNKWQPKLKLLAFAQEIGPYCLNEKDFEMLHHEFSQNYVDKFDARFPSYESEKVKTLLSEAKTEGKSYGGLVGIWIDNVPVGLGQPIFHKLKADFAMALMSIGATTALELGEGFDSTKAEGTEFHRRGQVLSPYGGVRGGLSTGERISLSLAFKPTSSVLDLAKKGRHDPCIVPRAIPVVEAMLWLVLADHLLWQKTDRI